MAKHSKDQQIAAQSSLKLVNDWASNCNVCLSLKELVAISVVLVDFVENGYTTELGSRLDKIEEHIKNKK